MNNYIKNLIKQGEHHQLDFKFEITDSKKIARSLVAFSNTNGGKLLIGVKDNGAIAGVRSDEEYHMVEAAAQMYCKPQIKFESKEWTVDGKTVLEIIIPKKNIIPYYALSNYDKWLVYIRVNDQNLLANSVLLKVWKKQGRKSGIHIKYTENEKFLLNYLKTNKQITLSKFCYFAKISRFKAENILVNFIVIKIIEIIFTEKQIYYKLSEDHNLT